eukprot:8887038-Lingulodinium_polyedra.AAC.1
MHFACLAAASAPQRHLHCHAARSPGWAARAPAGRPASACPRCPSARAQRPQQRPPHQASPGI